jgi:hypothetical protein
VINKKRKTSTAKPVESEDDQSKDVDEQLHLQNYKTDL